MAMEVGSFYDAHSTKPNIWALLSETKRILMAHSRHFLILSIIFLLPLSSFILLYPLLYSKLVINFINSPSQPIEPYTLLLTLLYSLSLTIFAFSGVSSITYSAFHAFYDKPLDLISSIKSIFTSFFPLLATTIVMQVILFIIYFCFSLLLLLLFIGAQLLGIKPSLYFIAFCAFLVILPMVFATIHLQIKWSLVPMIVVMEKCWGLEPLRRSSNLIKGMKRVALSLMLFFGIFGGMFGWFSMVSSFETSPNGILINFEWVKFLLLFAGKSLFLMMLQLFNTVANTVLYIFCKDIYGEHAVKSGNDYVKVPFDDNV